MDKKIKKAKFRNATEIVEGIGTLGVLVPITVALAPVVGLVRTAKGLSGRKENYGNITKQDIKDALKFYGEHLLIPAKLLRNGIKDISTDVSKRTANATANTPQALAETGVSDLIKLIENAPDVDRFYWSTRDIKTEKDEQTRVITIGDIFVIKFSDICIVTTEEKLEKPRLFERWSPIGTGEKYWRFVPGAINEVKSRAMLKFPVEQWISVTNAAIKRINELTKQAENDKKAAFGNEVAKRIADDHER